MNWQRLSLAARRRGPCCKAGALGKKRRNSRGVPSSLCAACTPRLAEREGFEPPVPLSTTVFKTVAIDHSAISPGLVCGCFFARSVERWSAEGRAEHKWSVFPAGPRPLLRLSECKIKKIFLFGQIYGVVFVFLGFFL